jgi:O-antigen ligase
MIKKMGQYTDDYGTKVISVGVFYILIYTPFWGVAWVGSIAGLTIGLTFIKGHYKSFAIEHRYFLIALLSFFLINIIFSPLPVKATTGAFAVLKGLMIYPAALLAGRAMSENYFNRLAMLFLIVNSLLLLALLLWVVNWDSTYDSLVSWSSIHVGNLHNLDNLVFISDLLALTLLLKVKALRDKILAGTSLLLFIFVSVLVQSEGSTLALAVCLMALIALYSTGQWKVLFIGLALFSVIVLHVFYFNPDLFTQLTGNASQTMIIRSEIYSQLINTWLQHPWNGWGFNTYKYVEETRVNGQAFLYPHHIYLESLFSLGLLGCGLILVWIVTMLRKIDSTRIQLSTISLFAFIALLYISVKGMSDMKLLSQQTIGWLAACLGILHGQTKRSD